MIRNFIEVVGIATEDELPERSYGQLIKYSETDQIIIPENKSGINDIYQIAVKVEVKSKRIINTVDCKTVVLEGIKNLKIVYTQDVDPSKVDLLNLKLPYNTFFEVLKDIDVLDHINIYILDAFFELIDKKRIYGHFLYLVDVRYQQAGLRTKVQKNEEQDDFLPFKLLNETSKKQIAISSEDLDNWSDDIAGEYL